ncbi:MAG: CRTAC1 family protein [bacterium]|nr:CRTAC1 family protein [bacterium]
MNCRRLFPRPSCFFLVCMVAMSAGFSRAQDLICHAQPDTIDALLELNRQAPYEDGAVLPALQLALHVLHESDGSGGYGQSAIDSLLAGLSADFASVGILFVPLARSDINNSQLFHSAIDSAGTLFTTYSDSTRIDIFLAESSGAIEGTTAGVPSTALVLTGAACGTSALSHFMSHCLGLYDTDETTFGVELESGANSEVAGDLVTDTPKVAPATNIMKEPDVGSWAGFTAEQGRRMSTAALALPELRLASYTSGVVYRDGSESTGLEDTYEGVPHNSMAADLNSDGALDLVLAADRSAFIAADYDATTGVPLFDDLTFAVFPSGVSASVRDAAGVIVADYDNDGGLDIYLPGANGHRLLHNNGSGVFADSTIASGINSSTSSENQTISGSWGDYDADGRIDLLVLVESATLEGCASTRLLRNTNGITFTEVTAAGISGSGCVSALWADFNSDHWMDLVLVQAGPDGEGQGDPYHGGLSRYFINDGDGTFTDATADGLDGENDHWTYVNCAAAIADVEPDGDLDIVYANNNESGYFKCVPLSGVAPITFGWSGGFVINNTRDPLDLDVCDYNLDGHPDYVFVDPDQYAYTMLNIDPEGGTQPLQFTSEVHEWYRVSDGGTAEYRNTGPAVVADFNRDGAVDVYMSRICTDGQFFHYYPVDENDPAHPLGNWIGISLRCFDAEKSNRFGIGATVKVSHGTDVQAQVVDGGSGKAGQGALDLVYGLGDHQGEVDVTVIWPDGETTQAYTGLETGLYHTLGQYKIPQSSLGFTKSYDPYLAMYTWEFTWTTELLTEEAGDEVTVTPASGHPECGSNSFVLNSGNSEIEITYDATNKNYRHTLSWDGGTCTDSCQYSFMAESALYGIATQSASPKSFKTSSCVQIR